MDKTELNELAIQEVEERVDPNLLKRSFNEQLTQYAWEIEGLAIDLSRWAPDDPQVGNLYMLAESIEEVASNLTA